MSKVFLPFGFFSSGKSDLPTITSINASNITTNSIDVSSNLVLEGTGGPVTAVGFVYSDSVTQPDLNTPNTTIVPASVPGSVPGSFQAQLTGLTDTTGFYIRAFATNSEGTRYTSTKLVETLWNAFTFKFDPQYVQSYGIEAGVEQMWIGTTGTGNFSISGVTIPYGDQKMTIKISQPTNPNIDDVIVDRDYSSATYAKHRVLVPLSNEWDSSDVYVQIIAQTSATGNFNNFRFNWVEQNNAFTEYQQLLTTALATTTVTQWGSTKWVTLHSMFNGTGTVYGTNSNINKRNSTVFESAGIPDLSDCLTMDYAWYYNYKQFSNENKENVAPFADFADPELSTWDFSNIKSMRSTWNGSLTGNGRQISWDNLDFSNCETFDSCFKGSKIGSGTSSYDNTLKDWTFNQNANQEISFREMFSFCERMEEMEIFDINTAVTNKMDFYAMFYYTTSLKGANLSNWGSKFSQCESLNNTSSVTCSNMFRNSGYNTNNTNGLKVDFTTWDFANFDKIDYMFSGSKFDTSTSNYLTMLTSKTIGSPSGAFVNGTDAQYMFNSATNIPPLHGWSINYVHNMNGMFNSINYTTYSAANQLDLSTWKTEIDKLDSHPPSYTGSRKLEIYNMFSSNGYSTDVRVPSGVETFEWCVNATNPPVIRAESLFRNCNGFNRDLNGMDIVHFYDISYMVASSTNFNNGQPAGQSTNPLTFKNGLRPFSAGFPIVNGVATDCDMRGLFSSCAAFNQEVNSWGDVRLFRKMGNIFNDTQSGTPQEFSYDIGDWLINPLPGFSNNIGTAWTPQQMDDTLIGWAKTWLNAINAGETIPQNLLIGWSGTPSNFNNPSCLPAATGGPYNVAADIQSVQDALSFFQSKSWTIMTNPCV